MYGGERGKERCQLTEPEENRVPKLEVGHQITFHVDVMHGDDAPRSSRVKSERFAFPDPNHKQSNGNYMDYTKGLAYE